MVQTWGRGSAQACASFGSGRAAGNAQPASAKPSKSQPEFVAAALVTGRAVDACRHQQVLVARFEAGLAIQRARRRVIARDLEVQRADVAGARLAANQLEHARADAAAAKPGRELNSSTKASKPLNSMLKPRHSAI